MAKYRKKPGVVEAIRWTGDNSEDVLVWALEHLSKVNPVTFDRFVFLNRTESSTLTVPTWEGETEASPGDWLIVGTQNELYPCKPEVFAEVYERA